MLIRSATNRPLRPVPDRNASSFSSDISRPGATLLIGVGLVFPPVAAVVYVVAIVVSFTRGFAGGAPSSPGRCAQVGDRVLGLGLVPVVAAVLLAVLLDDLLRGDPARVHRLLE